MRDSATDDDRDANDSLRSSKSDKKQADSQSGDSGSASTNDTEESDDVDPNPVAGTSGSELEAESPAPVVSETPSETELPTVPAAPADPELAVTVDTDIDPVPAQPVIESERYSSSGGSAAGTKTTTKEDVPAISAPVEPAVTKNVRPSVSITAISARSAASATGSAPVPAATPQTIGIESAVPAAAPGPIAMIAGAVNRFVSAMLSPFKALASTAPAGQNPLAWALLAFVRRTFFNQAPEVVSVKIGEQLPSGVITGVIDAVDPDEMGKKVQIRANVFAFPAQPRTPEPDCGCAVIDGVAGLPFMNDAYLGTEPGSNWHAPDAVDITCVYIGSNGVTYTGKEIGEVSIDGLGTGDVTLVFEGVLLSPTQERSVAQLQPHLGTGDLKGVRGTVISESTLDATGAATGVLTGEVVRPDVRYKVVKQPKHGMVSIDAVTGQFTYTPDPAFAELGGADSFQVVATDGKFNVWNLFKEYNGDPVTTINLNVASPVAV